MANLIDKLSGKNERELTAKIEELEKKLEATTAELVAQKEHSDMFQHKYENAQTELKSMELKLENIEKELTIRNSAYSNLESTANETETALKNQLKNMELQLKNASQECETLNQKLSDSETALSTEHEKLLASLRSLELSKPENGLSDEVIPTKDNFINLRDTVFNEYKAAQETEIKKLLESVKSYDAVPQLSIHENPSFRYRYPDGTELNFIIPDILSKLYNKACCTGWRVCIKFKHSTRDLTDMLIYEQDSMLLLFGQTQVKKEFFPSPAALKNPIQDEKQIIAIHPSTDGNEDFETITLTFKYEC